MLAVVVVRVGGLLLLALLALLFVVAASTVTAQQQQQQQQQPLRSPFYDADGSWLAYRRVPNTDVPFRNIEVEKNDDGDDDDKHLLSLSIEGEDDCGCVLCTLCAVCVCVCVCWLSGPLTYCWFVLDFGVHVRAVPASFLFSLRTLQAAQRGVSVELFQGILDRENVRASKLGTVCFNLNSPDVVGAPERRRRWWRPSACAL